MFASNHLPPFNTDMDGRRLELFTFLPNEPEVQNEPETDRILLYDDIVPLLTQVTIVRTYSRGVAG